MKHIFLLLLLLPAIAMADACDDFIPVDKVLWDKTGGSTICRDAYNGDPEAQFKLADWYANVEKNDEMAFDFVRQSAIQGCAKAQYVTGLMFYYGRGTDVNHLYARAFIAKAAKNGIPDALSMLGYMHFNGQSAMEDKITGREMLEKAAGKHSISALYRLAVIYREGDGVPVDNLKATTYFTQILPAIVQNAVSAELYPCSVYKDAD